MRRAVALLGVAFALALIVPGGRAGAAPALTPKASILVDADTGAVITGHNIHEPLPPASLTKIITALTAVAALDPHTSVPVSARTAGMPAHNMNMKEGQVWVLEDVLASLLVSSANDAGMALAERVSGTAEAFGDALSHTATRLGMSDNPELRDPSGLDDEFSVGGGNKVSARDLAIAARAVLAEPRLAPIVASKVVSFTGGDGIAHRLGNHNRLLRSYDGAIGMKTGYTKRSLHSLVAVATRNGRTMIAVILNHPGETYTPAAALLDQGFATPVGAESQADHLPAPPGSERLAAATVTPSATGGTAELGGQQAAAGGPVTITTTRKSRSWVIGVAAFLLKVILGLAVTVGILRIRVHHRAAQRPTRPVRTIDLAEVEARPRPAPARPARVAAPAPAAQTAAAPAFAPTPAPAFAPPPALAMFAAAPRPARPVAPERSGPRPARPVKRQRPLRARPRATPVEPQIDPRLAQRFEILVRTGQVVP